jgi:hypothetical protein
VDRHTSRRGRSHHGRVRSSHRPQEQGRRRHQHHLRHGAAQTCNVTPESATLRAANQYVTAFNALATQLAAEAEQQGGAPTS